MSQVRFDYYETFALTVAVDLVNTRSESTGDDTLATAADLARFLDAYTDLPSVHPGVAVLVGDELAVVTRLYADVLARGEPTDADARSLRALRARLRDVFTTATGDPAGASEILNEQLRTHRALPRISTEHGSPHLHFEAARDGLVHWVAVTVLMALVLFVCHGNATRLGICASAGCRRAFIDRSKNGSKTYCSDTCAHRESVTAYRNRQRAPRD